MNKRLMNYILWAFTASGACSLIYEVVWQRQLALIFGSTLPATTAVLTAFMGGLAAGSWLWGRISNRLKRPYRVYGLLEIAIGVFCMFMPFFFRWITQLHIILYGRLGNSMALEGIRFLMAIIILAIPCALMGGTLPVLSRGFVVQQGLVGKSLSRLYFFNTIGASSGTLLAGFFLIRILGMARTTFVTASISILLGGLIVFLSKDIPDCPISERKQSDQSIKHCNITVILPFFYAFLGAAAMGTQVAWTRSLNLVLGSTVYAFALMLTTFLFGIAIGSIVIGKFVDRSASPLALVGVLSISTCISIVLSITLISRLPVILLMLFPTFHHNFFMWQTCLFALIMIVVFPATFCMGALFPAFGKAYISNIREVGKRVGELYVWNTVGGIIGSISCGFLLIPLIGTRLSLVLFATVFLLVGMGLLFWSNHNRRNRIQIVILFVVCLFGYRAIPAWEPALLDSGVYVYAPLLLEGFESNREILFDKEGFHSHVTVSEKNSVRSLRINGKTDGSDGNDLATQALLAILPLVHIENPARALIIGLGTGVTAGSALNFPNLQVDCVEIDDAVILAATFFNHVSGNPFSNKNFQVIHADARTVLGAGQTRYDVIISEPSNPWITGVSNLFTVDYFRESLDNLTDDGIMCQWIHSYYMDTDTLSIIFRSFQKVFTYCSLWEGSPGDYLILGSRRNVEALTDYTFLFDNPAVQEDLKRLGILTSEHLLSRYILGPDEFLNMTRSTGTILNTDDLPYVEFNAPMSLYHNTVTQNKEQVDRFRSAAKSK